MKDLTRDTVIYVDMDGVLADFEGAVRDKLGITMDAPKSKLWGKIQHHNDTVEPWFYSLPMMSDAKQLMSFLLDNFDDVRILTASGTTPKDGPAQKMDWVRDHFGNIKVNVVRASGEKAAFADPNSLLIDDRSQSIDPFIAAGGLGILHTDAATTIATIKSMLE
jgi:5'(3')-deoxyribonucleotidase